MTQGQQSPQPPDLLLDAAARAGRYLGASDRTVAPAGAAVDRLRRFERRLQADPLPPDQVLDELDRFGSPATVLSTAGRYFGFVTGGTDPAARAAAILAGAWDQNLALPVMSPVAAHLDDLAAGWVTDLLGLPPDAVTTFCAGASIANLTGILAGRDALLARLGWDTGERGLLGAPALSVVTSAEIHASVHKALRAAGIGRDSVTLVATDRTGAVDASAFPPVDDRTLVVLQAGNVNTGHSDPFSELIPAARAAGAWVHVDGAFGMWLRTAPARRHLVEGFELADSWATDAHKWLNVPYDCGIAICADGANLRRALAVDAAYLADGGERALMQLGLQMSQRARGIETWAALRSQGRSGIADLVERCCALATRFAGLLGEQGVQILAPVVANQVLAHFSDDATTDAVIAAVQDDGTCWAGGTTWQGKRAMRISVSDRVTTADDVDRSAAAMLSCWAQVRSAALS
jgi:glutamate/tyrosine decarboxylase-like PLP-dependent enzyme